MFRTRTSLLADTALLGLRGVVGGYLAAHGAQKLFGSFGGHGLEGTGQFFEEGLDLAPGKEMAALAGGAELAGGSLTALGLGGPLGPMAIIGAMATASQTAHRGNGPFTTDGGPELPLTNIAASAAIAVLGPGRFSLDTLLRVKPSKAFVGLAALAGASMAAFAVQTQAARRARPTPSVEVDEEPLDVELPLSA